MRITVITPTCDRPIGFALAERMMRRQTRQPDEWIVADGGLTPVVCTRGQIHVHAPKPPGVENFIGNLIAGLREANGDVVCFWEDDDWYAPTHLAQLTGQLEANPRALAAGDDDQRYYNIATRQWRVFKNLGACLCQTMLRREALPRFESVVHERLRLKSYGVDTTFWRSIPTERRSLERAHTVVGIKGLPGRAGLGVGHRPDQKWTDDPEFAHLRTWIGEQDLQQYRALATVVTGV